MYFIEEGVSVAERQLGMNIKGTDLHSREEELGNASSNGQHKW